ncbi:hypothetical protein A2773_05285 [Candidatus Gottesmanbacteria bacterium RIFCSPHIGHO2_01_FULL_39_10]|uniref:Uncharacterized protein n=1 Tax=Candidatus Gottesmanbacteria bacterium RIFCSPHIGHO2_01_FULL_39_10 TaxID=1798375 RepID=A0A1F5ZP78_9BACT|nr:MAG: hypothetical protein A2773_05285 [Candidatus Gottesmanbacteria bacterium RIFCSPHIGHO2_01_FULL_39_10]
MHEILDAGQIERVFTYQFECPYCHRPVRRDLLNDTSKTQPLPMPTRQRPVKLKGLEGKFEILALKDHIHCGECPKFIPGQFGIMYPPWMKS